MYQALVVTDTSGNKTVEVLDVIQDQKMTSAVQRLKLGDVRKSE